MMELELLFEKWARSWGGVCWIDNLDGVRC